MINDKPEQPEFVLVPREPTNAMWAAWTSAHCELDKTTGLLRFRGDYGNWLYNYQIMIAAAPPEVSRPPAPSEAAYTYASTQATRCAGCGEHKHTPLRVDRMDGYVCLTCIDKRLEELLDAEAEASEAARWYATPHSTYSEGADGVNRLIAALQRSITNNAVWRSKTDEAHALQMTYALVAALAHPPKAPEAPSEAAPVYAIKRDLDAVMVGASPWTAVVLHPDPNRLRDYVALAPSAARTGSPPGPQACTWIASEAEARKEFKDALELDLRNAAARKALNTCASEAEERKAFETYVTGEGWPIERESDGDTYRDPRTHCGWWSWQAHAALGRVPGDKA